LPSLVIDIDSCCNLLDSGEVFTWGCGANGQLGTGNDLSQYTPQCVNLSASEYYSQNVEHELARDISCGSNYTGLVASK